MITIGLDLHKRESQLCIAHEDGSIGGAPDRDEPRSIHCSARAAASCAHPVRSQHRERVGRAAPREHRPRGDRCRPQLRTDVRRTIPPREDGSAGREACRLGAYRKAHRSSDERRHVRAQLAVREALVRIRTRYTAIVKALVRRDGLRIVGSAAHLLEQKVTALQPSPQLLEELQPLFALLGPLNTQIKAADDGISQLEQTDPAVALLTTMPGIGAITASAVVAVADDITRFASAHQFEAFLGLVPGELSSGDKRHIGHITKAGNARVRYLLVEAAWRIMRSKQDDTTALRAWAIGIANRRGKRIAVVALARRLAGILYAMWKHNEPFDARRIRFPRPRTIPMA